MQVGHNVGRMENSMSISCRTPGLSLEVSDVDDEQANLLVDLEAWWAHTGDPDAQLQPK